MNALLLPPIAAVRLLRRLEHRLRPRISAQSDFRYPAPGPLNYALGWVFGAEGAVLKRADIPFGVSILALARKPAAAAI